MSPQTKRRMRLRAPGSPSSGFTMIELTVALVAGLIVAMGIVALSREATNTFQEEGRSSAAEAGLRTAIDRLRADIQRAGYMCTGNILADTGMAYRVGGANYVSQVMPTYTGITGLASLRLDGGGSNANGLALSGQQTPALTPDRILISGNMTSAEQFDVALVSPVVSGGCVRLYLSPNAPAVYRVLSAGPSGATELRNLFFPSALSSNKYQFIVRIVDDTGRYQFAATCPNGAVAGVDPTNQPYVDIDNNATPLLRAGTGVLGGISGLGAGRTWINPVQTVQWEITSAKSNTNPPPPADIAALNGQSLKAGDDPTKYDLMRTYIDAMGNPVPDTKEIVAEYAVDLSFAFSVDQSVVPSTPRMVSFAFDDAVNNGAWAPLLPLPATNTGAPHVRSVRIRLVTRTAQPDRAVNIPPAPANYAGQRFLYRYCVAAGAGGCANNGLGAPHWARTRTLTAEVALSNQARSFY